MKTLTEFSGFVLKEAMAKKAALLTEGKTEEEAQAAINEQLKLDEAKVGFYKNVVDMTSSRVDRVKRVVVALKASETEKVPEAFTEREGHFYLIEYFPTADGRSASRGRDDDRDFGRGRGGRGGNDRGRGRGPREGGNDRGGRPMGGERRPPRGDRPAGEPRTPGATSALIQTANANAPRPPRPPREPKQPRAPRPPQGDRPQRAPRGPKGAGELRLVLKGQTQTLQGSGVNTPQTESAPTTESNTQQQA